MFRVVAILLLFSAALLLGGCSSTDKMAKSMEASLHGVADKLPDWAGGPPKGLPPRPTDPGYAAYKLEVEGRATPVPATQHANLAPLY